MQCFIVLCPSFTMKWWSYVFVASLSPRYVTDMVLWDLLPNICSPPARWGLLDFIRVVLLLLLLLHLLLVLLLLLHHLCLHFHVHFRLANSSPSSSPTSARTVHCWTSTARVWAHWAPLDRPSSVSTAGPQPGTLRAQWAPLDLNLGPSELNEHRWPSTAR